MGASCIGCPTTRKKKPKYSLEPDDTSDFNPEKLGYRLRKLEFKGQVDNVEIINYPYDIISINFVISQFFEYSLPRQKKNSYEKMKENGNELGHSNKIKWKSQTNFNLRMDEYELRKTFIKVSIFSELPHPILQENLNLFQIITGPYHHDIALNFQNKVTSRLLFDLKISQKFIILINPLQVSVVLNQQYPGEEFNYSFNSYSRGQKISSSDGSMPQKISILSKVQGNYRQLKPEDECESPTKIRKGPNFNKMIKNTMISSLNWMKPKEAVFKSLITKIEEKLPEQVLMPSFKFQLSASEINRSYLQFILWNIQFNKSLDNNQAILFSDCYLSFGRLLESEYVSVEELEPEEQNFNQQNRKKTLNKIQNRVCIIEEPLIKDGRSVGKLTVKLNITNQTFFSQLSLHARTQDGIVYMNSMFKNYVGKQERVLQSDRIMKIQSCFQRIVDIMYKLSQLKSQKKRNWTELNRMEEKALQDLNLMISLLNITIEQSLIIARKHNFDEIMEKQNIFLGILERLYIFLQEEITSFVQEIWMIIFLTLKRGEFYLQNIGFGQFDSTNPANSKGQNSNDTSEPNTSIIYPKKIRTALRYQEIVYKVLISSLRYNYESQRDTIIEAEAFKAYAYFRVPKFREQVLKCIVRNQEDIEFLLQTNGTPKRQSHSTLIISKYEEKATSHLDWQKYFYFHLKNEKKSNDLNLLLTSHFKNNLWFRNITERKESFYIFIEYFTKKMALLGKRLKLINYSICQGYNKLVRAFLIELKRKPIVEYEACVIQTSTVLLSNQDLINIIIPIVVEKTNLYDTVCLNQFLNIFSNFLKFLTQNGTKTIPQKFNHKYFFKIIKLILESDYSYAISKILVIIHTYFECFSDEFKDVLCLYLLSKVFFRLFFHWSYSIRIIFYHLFLIKIYWSKLNGVTQNSNNMDTYQNENCQIHGRYKQLIKILNAAERQKSIKKKHMKRAQKQEYYIKMKRKISNKFRQNSEVGIKALQSQQVLDSSSQHSNEEEKLNLSKLHTLCELKNGYNRSETLCSSEIKEHLRKIKTQKSFSSSKFSQFKTTQRDISLQEESQLEAQNLGINLRIKNKKKSSKNSRDWTQKNGEYQPTVKEEIEKLNEEYIKKLSLVNHKASSCEEKPLVYTFFGNNDYELEEISMNQENKILLGMEEFRQTQQFVEKFILQKGVAPHVNLDPEIELDSNEFKMIEESKL